MSNCAYVLRTWNESGSSPADGVIDRSLRLLERRRGEVDVVVVCEPGRLMRRDEGLVTEARSEGGPWGDRGAVDECPFKAEEACERDEEGRLWGGLGLRYRDCGEVASTVPSKLGRDEPLPLNLWGGFGGGMGGNSVWASAEKSSSIPIYGELVSVDDDPLPLEALKAAPMLLERWLLAVAV
jgi:hypothetical protein